ncbi:amidohydrolase family protein [Chloroflexota bacterium]
MIEINPDVIVHFNGGSTSCSFPVMKKLAENCPAFLELNADGSYRAMRQAIDLLRERNEFSRIIVGTDGPGGSACEFAGIIRLVARISCLFDIPAATVMAMGTGNDAKAYGLNTGMIKPGREADLIVLDAPLGSQGSNALEAMEAGDRPNMGMVMIDGTVIVRMQARLFPTTKKVLINGQEDPTRYTDIQFD